MVENMFFLRRTVENDVLFGIGQVLEGNVRANAHGAADIGHQRPHQCAPRHHRALVNGQRLIGHQRGQIHGAHRAGTVAGGAGALRVKCQLFRRGRCEFGTADGADQILSRGNRQRGRDGMSVGAAVAGQSGVHQPQTVQQLRAGSECGTNAGHGGALMQSQCGGHI